MKKVMFLTMLFGLMIVFTGSVSAQKGKVIGATGSQKLTPKVGNLVTFNIHQPASDNPSQGIKGGRKYALISIFATPEGKGQQIDLVIDINVMQDMKPGVKTKTKISKLENPIPDIILGDKVSLDEKKLTLTFSRGNKVFGAITFARM